MKTVLRACCGALVLTVLLTAPATAGPFFRSDLVCDVGRDGLFSDLSPQRPFMDIAFPTGDVDISTIHGLPPGTAFLCQLFCLVPQPQTDPLPFHEGQCGTTDTSGRLRAQRLPGFASRANLGVDVCAAPFFRMFDIGGVSPAECVIGFAHPAP
jgi:hypothetical protein